MDSLTKAGVGSFIFGLAGDIAMQVVTIGWTISPDTARIITYICLALMLFGLVLILLSFRTKKKIYDNQIDTLIERLRISTEQLDIERKEKVEYRKEKIDKKIIPDKLLLLDNYLKDSVKKQDITFEQIKAISPRVFAWYDWIRLIILEIILITPILRKYTVNTQINNVIQFSTKFNISLAEIGLGTIPIVEKDEYYNLYTEIVNLESGFPIFITTKIHRNIMLSISLNSLRILQPESSFWKSFEEKSIFGDKLPMLKNSFNLLIMPVDNSLAALRGEVSSDIEKYFEGKNQ